jgi:hypothetical protein
MQPRQIHPLLPLCTLVFLLAIGGCASPAPTPTPLSKATTAPVPGPKKTAVVDAGPAQTQLPQVESHPQLAPGSCRNSLDCDDTSALAPEGFRWGCKNQKCVTVALPNLAADDSSVASKSEGTGSANLSKRKQKSAKANP